MPHVRVQSFPTVDYGFGAGLAYKDVRLCIDEDKSLGVPMVVGAAVREVLAVTNSIYGGESDCIALKSLAYHTRNGKNPRYASQQIWWPMSQLGQNVKNST